MSPILASPCIYKRTKILHGDICFSSLADTFCKKIWADYMYSPFTKVTYILNFLLPLFRAFFQKSLKCFLPDYSPHFAQIKQLTVLIFCLFFFFR